MRKYFFVVLALSAIFMSLAGCGAEEAETSGEETVHESETQQQGTEEELVTQEVTMPLALARVGSGADDDAEAVTITLDPETDPPSIDVAPGMASIPENGSLDWIITGGETTDEVRIVFQGGGPFPGGNPQGTFSGSGEDTINSGPSDASPNTGWKYRVIWIRSGQNIQLDPWVIIE